MCSAIHPLGLGSPAFQAYRSSGTGCGGSSRSARSPTRCPRRGDAAPLGGRDRRRARGRRPGVEAADGAVRAGRDAARRRAVSPLSVPRHPVAMARFGLTGLRGATRSVRRFSGDASAALFAGMAAHSVPPPSPRSPAAPASCSLRAATCRLAGGQRWVRRRSSPRWWRSFAESWRGVVRGHLCRALDELPPAPVLSDVTPRQLINIAGDHCPSRFRRRLERFRYGPGFFKVDYALGRPVPWAESGVAGPATVHLGGTLAEVAAAESAWGRGRTPSGRSCCRAGELVRRDPGARWKAHRCGPIPRALRLDAGLTDRIEAHSNASPPASATSSSPGKSCEDDRRPRAAQPQPRRRRHHRRCAMLSPVPRRPCSQLSTRIARR